MTADANRWIITTHSFFEHKTVEAAIKELARVKTLHPDKHFRMIRIKRTTHDSDCQFAKSPVAICDCPMGRYEETTPVLELARAS